MVSAWKIGKIIAVDDEENMRNLIQRILKQAGYDVVTAANGQEAMDTVYRSNGEIGVMVLDVKMPGMSGMEVLQQVSKDWPDICVIMATAVIDTENAVEAMKLGAYDYIIKPFNSDDLLQRVRKAVEKRTLKRQNEEYRISLEIKVKEQTQQLQDSFSSLLETLTREHNLIYGLSKERSQGGKQLLSKLPPELQKPMSSVDEYREALLKILKGTRIEPDRGPSSGGKGHRNP